MLLRCMQGAAESIMLVDANGNARSWNDQLRLGERAVSRSDSHTAEVGADSEYKAEIKLIDNSGDSDSRVQPVYKDCLLLSFTAMPTVMIGLVALLFAAGTSAIVAFIPLQVGLFGLLVVFAGSINQKTGWFYRC